MLGNVFLCLFEVAEDNFLVQVFQWNAPPTTRLFISSIRPIVSSRFFKRQLLKADAHAEEASLRNRLLKWGAYLRYRHQKLAVRLSAEKHYGRTLLRSVWLLWRQRAKNRALLVSILFS